MSSEPVKIVSFSGIDGAGKSTQIKALCVFAEELGLRCSVLTFWDDVVAFSRFREKASTKAFKGDPGVGSPERPIQRRDKNVSSWYITAIRLFLYMADAFSLTVAVSKVLNGDANIVVFDRYIYDELANLPLQHFAIRLYVRLLLVLVPRPDIALLLDADPADATQRKPEYPIDFVRRNREAYLRLSRIVPEITVIPPLPIERITENIRKILTENLQEESADLPLTGSIPDVATHRMKSSSS